LAGSFYQRLQKRYAALLSFFIFIINSNYKALPRPFKRGRVKAGEKVTVDIAKN